MASDSMMKIAEAEAQAASIEQESQAQAQAVIAEAERLSLAESDEMARATEAECKNLVLDAEKKCQVSREEQMQSYQDELLFFRNSVSERIPRAVAQVRRILIGKE